ncbi:MarR family winged helix-turn-helix transcriptional regulator [Paracoccus tegillarcae]|uniref:MarR family transcriptional regulator n=1 Tax=Paracoccus tegillarcae TaxID=1529068 RepID=A0A2K9EJL6_9RHOB|nr:MarR family transcriptional regulator [Paracoccus tegillarcae]AUH34579.1 MarR family transcriptional regulator [Paracoccus tegillarcae]
MSVQVPDFDLSGFLPYRISVAAQRISTGLASQYREIHDISRADWRVLVHLLDSGEAGVGELGQMVNLEKSKVSRAAARLAEQGLIVKIENESDRRLVRMSLTEKGHALMARLLPVALAYQERLETLLGDHLDAVNAALDILNTEDLS